MVKDVHTIISFPEVPATEDMVRWKKGNLGEWGFGRGRFHRNPLVSLSVRMPLKEQANRQ